MRGVGPAPLTTLRFVILALAVVVATAAPAAAQGRQTGVRAGVNLANVSTEAAGDAEGLDMLPRLVAGVFLTWPVTSWLDLQPEVLYSAKGAKADAEGFESSLLLDYLEIPVLAKVPLRTLGRSAYVVAGPAFGVRLRARARAEFDGSTEELDISEDVERTDVGAVVGAGFEIRSIIIDGRYTFGFTDIDQAEDVESKNRVISFTVGFRF
jgi:hypothetical protein